MLQESQTSLGVSGQTFFFFFSPLFKVGDFRFSLLFTVPLILLYNPIISQIRGQTYENTCKYFSKCNCKHLIFLVRWISNLARACKITSSILPFLEKKKNFFHFSQHTQKEKKNRRRVAKPNPCEINSYAWIIIIPQCILLNEKEEA